MQASTAALASSNKLGNRLVAIRGGLPETYTPTNLNQYSDIDGVPQTHDFDGNLTSDGTATYTYDAENHLTQVVNGPTTIDYTYDAFGRRASKTVNGVVTKFFYDGDDLLVETGNDPNALIARYLVGPGLDEPLERKGSTTHYYSADGLGSIVHLTTASGAIAESYTYDVFGQPTIRNGSGTIIPTTAVGNRFLFTGREWESELGIYFYRARYFSPKTGRFLSRDPIGPVDGPNLYTYVLNNPVNWLDPFGLQVKKNGPQPPTLYDDLRDTDGMKPWPGGPGADGNEGPGIPSIDPPTPPRPALIPIGGSPGGPVVAPIPVSGPGGIGPGITPAGGKKGNRKGKGKDIKQVEDVARQLGINGKKRRQFGDYVEKIKRQEGRGDLSYQELIELGKEFLGYQ